jgi:hypothetical protein
VKSSKDISGGFAFVFFHVARADELIFWNGSSCSCFLMICGWEMLI